MKKLIYEMPVLAVLDVKKTIAVSCDVSQHGLGVVLLQDCQPVAHASPALTDTERIHAQFEKELLYSSGVWTGEV